MNGNNKEEIEALPATGAGKAVGGMGLATLGGSISVPRIGVRIAVASVASVSGYDCTICSKKHKVFSPSQNCVSS